MKVCRAGLLVTTPTRAGKALAVMHWRLTHPDYSAIQRMACPLCRMRQRGRKKEEMVKTYAARVHQLKLRYA